MKILVMEDDPSLRDVAVMMLEALFKGILIIVAPNGKIGLEKFVEENPDVVLSDVEMPEVNGIQVLEEIKNLAPAIPVIMMTGYSESTESEMLQKGAKDVLLKPFTLERLHNALAPYLKM